MESTGASPLSRAIALHRQGALTDAAHQYEQLLQHDPANADALYGLAQVSCQQGQLARGVEFAHRALAVDSRRARTHRLLGMALSGLARHQEALASFDRAIALAPDDAASHGSRADVLAALGRLTEAIVSFEQALTLRPDSVADLCNLGALLLDVGRDDEAVACFDRALALAPDFVEAHYNRGSALARLGRHTEAITSYQRALAINPNNAEVHNNYGNVLRELGRSAEALASYDAALAIEADHPAALINRAIVLIEIGRPSEAIRFCDRALAHAPNDAGALFRRANALAKLGRQDDAIAGYEQVLAADPAHRYALGALALWCAATCNWQKTAELTPELSARIADGRSFVSPLTALTFSDNSADLLRCSQHFIEHEIPQQSRLRTRSGSSTTGKMRVAYLSADFNSHPLPYLMAELFERHDRRQFEIIGVSFGDDDGSDIRARVIKAFDRYFDAVTKSDAEIAALVDELGVDIAVDLNGYTESARPAVLARRPAPVQVSYLGFLGTMGADFIDYVIGDETVLPAELQPYYTERIVRLPDCFQVNDSTRKIGARTPTRAEAGLPARGFVFCCFNGNYKITAPVFDIWMRLIKLVDGSVFWLIRSNDTAVTHLRQEAAVRGVDPARLVFAAKASPEDHLARHRLADLFLDTLPINAGATASDALWAGLPIVTRMGVTFPGRISASLLRAVGLGELVTHSVEDYEALALALARDPARLAAIRQRLQANRLTTPLFDTDRFRRHLEAAYMTMYKRHRRGEQPQSFSVAPL